MIVVTLQHRHSVVALTINCLKDLSLCYGAVVPDCWVVPGLCCASGSAIPPVCGEVRALLSLCSGTSLGLLEVSSRFINTVKQENFNIHMRENFANMAIFVKFANISCMRIFPVIQ